MTRQRTLASSLVLTAILALLAGCGGKSTGPEGDWQGKLAVPGAELTIVLHVTRGEDGKLAAAMDSPDQGAFGLEAADVAFADRKLTLKIPSIAGSFEGALQPGDSVLSGTWRQGPAALPLELRRSAPLAAPNRPQEPKEPYPYRAEEVAVENPAAGITLAGTLTLPDSDGPHPAVVLISGSGAQDRDELVFGHRPFLVIADYLTRRGIAVLRYDDRGVGKSTGSYSAATTTDLATDAAAAVRYLGTRPEIDRGRIGLLGHSEGGIIAPLAADSVDVAFVILMAGTGLRGDSILMLQTRLVAESEGQPVSTVDSAVALERRLLDIAMNVPDTAKAAAEMRRLMVEAAAAPPDSQQAAASDEAIAAQVKTVLSPWFRYFIAYDPAPALRRLKMPVLAVVGEKDVQVAPKENLAAIETALKQGGNKDCTVRQLPGLNHLLQTAATGAVTEYAKTEETIAPEALALFGDWILARVATGK
ncbi:MAG: alpha/beta fold hydrolase [bacterium]